VIVEVAVRTLLDPSWLLLSLGLTACIAVALMVIAYTAWSTRND
jgi:hypothetical protein